MVGTWTLRGRKEVLVHFSGGRILPTSERDWWRKPPATVSFAVAALSVAAATVVTRGLHLQIAPTPPLFCAVLLSAWFGGVGPGLLATALSMLAVAYYFMPPIGSFAVEAQYIPAFVVLRCLAAEAALR
jgi:K+-sensing histidine kinase KdpD